ncbi:MAG: hypothetical protein Q9191_008405 [Dirinaria sp. TL-2023a]
MNAVADLVDSSPETKEALYMPAAGRMLKTLVQSGRFNQHTQALELSEPLLKFHDTLYAKIESDIINWATSGNSFVVVSMLEAGDFSNQDALRKKLKQSKRELVEACDEENKGSQLIMQKLQI